MTRSKPRKTSARVPFVSRLLRRDVISSDTPAAPRAAAKTCAYPDGSRAVAVRQTPRGPRYLCEAHAVSQRRIGATVEDL